jgi:hypothetical protein
MPAILVIPPKSARPVQEAEGLPLDFIKRCGSVTFASSRGTEHHPEMNEPVARRGYEDGMTNSVRAKVVW